MRCVGGFDKRLDTLRLLVENSCSSMSELSPILLDPIYPNSKIETWHVTEMWMSHKLKYGLYWRDIDPT